MNFGDIDNKFATEESSEIFLQSIPYDGTSTYGKGANNGFKAFIDASRHLELYDIECNYEVYKKGIYTLPELDGFETPEDAYSSILSLTEDMLDESKFLTFFGGEHSISIGIIEAFQKKYKNLSILQIDAHSDLRKSFEGSEYNHACAMHKASQNGHVIQVGIRSMDSSELPFLKRDNCFFMEEINSDSSWMKNALEKLKDNVYISFDLDALDPSIMPSTGTPEPGGLMWYETTQFLKKVFDQKNVVGFDIVELCPIENLSHPNFTAAKLYYKMLTYKFYQS